MREKSGERIAFGRFSSLACVIFLGADQNVFQIYISIDSGSLTLADYFIFFFSLYSLESFEQNRPYDYTFDLGCYPPVIGDNNKKKPVGSNCA